MRRFSVSLFAISFFIFSMCSCKIDTKVTPVVHFTADAFVELEDEKMTMKVVSAQDTSVSVEVVSPKNIKGLCYQKVNDTLYIEYDNLRCTTKSDYLTAYNPFEVLMETLLSLNAVQLTYISTKDGCDIYSGRSSIGEYAVFVDEKSGHITRIKPSQLNFEISFIENKTL